MELRIGAPVDCSDQACGTLTRVVADPRSWRVTHVGVEPPAGHALARLVPLALVAETGERVTLNCTRVAWQRLPHLEDVQFVDDPAGRSWGPLLFWPLTGPFSGADLPLVVEHLPPGEVEISGTNDIWATDGPVGPLDGVVVDRDGRLTHLLLEEGHWWRKKEVPIPAGSLEGMQADEIHLKLSKDAIASLPARTDHAGHE